LRVGKYPRHSIFWHPEPHGGRGWDAECLAYQPSHGVKLTTDEGSPGRVLLRASPGDSVGMIAHIMGGASRATATALTAYHLDQSGIAAVLREHPELAANLEALAWRSLAWLQCEAAAHVSPHIEKPEMLLSRVRQFLHRLSA